LSEVPNGALHENGTNASNSSQSGLLGQMDATNPEEKGPKLFSTRFGEYGGSYAPVSLSRCLLELEEGIDKIRNDSTSGQKCDHTTHISEGWAFTRRRAFK
jgi:tryptophan synthase